MEGQPYQASVSQAMFSVDSLSLCHSNHIRELRRTIYNIFRAMPDVGAEIPIKWLRYEQVLQQVLDKKVAISHIDMIREISRDAGVYTDQELRAILKFYHSSGKITFFGDQHG